MVVTLVLLLYRHLRNRTCFLVRRLCLMLYFISIVISGDFGGSLLIDVACVCCVCKKSYIFFRYLMCSLTASCQR